MESIWEMIRSGWATRLAKIGAVFVVVSAVSALPHPDGGVLQEIALIVFFPLAFPLHFAAQAATRAMTDGASQTATSWNPREWSPTYLGQGIPMSRRRWIYVSIVGTVTLIVLSLFMAARDDTGSVRSLWLLSILMSFYVNAYQTLETYREFQEQRHD